MNPRRTLWIAAALVALAVQYVVFERSTGPVTAAVDRGDVLEAGPIVVCEAADVREIELRTARGEISAARSGERWQTTASPENERWASLAFASIAEAVCTLPALDRIPAPDSLEEYGLVKPAIEATLDLGPERKTLRIGDLSPVRNRVYAMVDGEPEVLGVGALLRAEFEKAARYAK